MADQPIFDRLALVENRLAIIENRIAIQDKNISVIGEVINEWAKATLKQDKLINKLSDMVIDDERKEKALRKSR